MPPFFFGNTPMAKEKTLKEYLNALPKAVLTGLCGNGDKKIISVTALINDMIARYADTHYLTKLLTSLDEEARALLRFIYLEGRAGADASVLAHAFSTLKEEVLSAKLSELQNRFLIYGVKSTPFRYYIFQELKTHLLVYYIREGARMLKAGKDGPAKGCGDSLFRDLVLFMLSLSCQPLKRTKHGHFNKKQMDNMTAVFSNRFSFTGYAEHELPPLLLLMLHFMKLQEFVFTDEERMVLTSRGLKWLEQPLARQTKEWFDYLTCNGQEEKSRLTLGLLQSGPLAQTELVEYLFARSGEDQRPMPGIFERLYHGGFIDLIEAGSGAVPSFLISERGKGFLNDTPLLPESAVQATILPTFELLVPRELQSHLLKNLFWLTEIEKGDTLITFKLTRESLYAGLNRGLSAQDILPFFKTLCPRGLPQNILFSLEEWLSAHGVVSFETHFILRVKTREAYDKIKGILQGSKFVYDEMAPIGFSVRFSDYHDLFAILTRLGFAPSPFISPVLAGNGKKGETILDCYLKREAMDAEGSEEYLLPETQPVQGVSPARDNGKYGGQFKVLPYNELIHVLNYSILMEQRIEVELKKEKRALFYPTELLLHSSEPCIKGRDGVTGERNEIRIDDIERIRVEG